jgi:DNA-binding response OmpR family regulator
MSDKKDLVLVVDDNPQNLQVLGPMLENKGYDVAFATSGEQALEFIDSEIPDLVLLDIMMPDMDGYQVCKRLKKEKTTASIPVIFLTAKSDTDDIVQGFEAGGVDYVTKPFNSAELLARVKTHLELKNAREEIKTLRGIIPICAHCKKVRNDSGFWEQVEVYVREHSEAEFTHGLCADCEKELYGNQNWYKKSRAKDDHDT